MAKRPPLPHDTPVDTPAVGVGDLIERPRLGLDPSVLGANALTRARSVESLEAIYAAWAELGGIARSTRKQWAEEKSRLETQGELLLGAMKSAARVATPAGQADALAPLNASVAEAEARLAEVKKQFAEQTREAEDRFALELTRLRDEVRAHVQRRAAVARPAFRIAVRVIGDRRILHADRLTDDDAIVALYALTGRVPSRYGYLADDSVDDLSQPPPSLYADEGVTEVRPDALTLASELTTRTLVWPVKGHLPLPLGERWLRWVTRGAVLEAELSDGAAFHNQLSREEAEAVTGLLLAQKLAGKIELELVR